MPAIFFNVGVGVAVLVSVCGRCFLCDRRWWVGIEIWVTTLHCSNCRISNAMFCYILPFYFYLYIFTFVVLICLTVLFSLNIFLIVECRQRRLESTLWLSFPSNVLVWGQCTILWLYPSQLVSETGKWLSSLPILMQNQSGADTIA